MARILVVDDEEGIREFLAEALERRRAHGRRGRRRPGSGRPAARAGFDLMITDLRMPGALDGMELLRSARAEQPEMEVIVLTAHGTVDTAVEAMKLGAFDYLQKPLSSPDELRLLVGARARAPQSARSRTARRARRQTGAAARPTAIRSWRRWSTRCDRVAPTDATVLLLGESGTGKEVAARSPPPAEPARATGRSCRSTAPRIAETLMESEMFGHEKGAFTGAAASARGRLELADGGTLFLDEIGELKPELQAKLLRVLQERRFERVGGTPHDRGRRALDRRHQPRPRGDGARGRVPRGPLPPAGGVPDPAAAAARAAAPTSCRWPPRCSRASASSSAGRGCGSTTARGALLAQAVARQRPRAGQRARARRHPGRRAPIRRADLALDAVRPAGRRPRRARHHGARSSTRRSGARWPPRAATAARRRAARHRPAHPLREAQALRHRLTPRRGHPLRDPHADCGLRSHAGGHRTHKTLQYNK